MQNLKEIVEFESQLSAKENPSREIILKAKQLGFSDKQIARILNKDEDNVRALRKAQGIEPVYKLVDTCAAEFEAWTPYYYSTYETPYQSARAPRAPEHQHGG